MALDNDPTPFGTAIAEVLGTITPGEVLTYAEVAAEAGHPGAARAVASALSADHPWWRVVGAGGHIIAPSAIEQVARLREEGHRIDTTTNPPRLVEWR